MEFYRKQWVTITIKISKNKKNQKCLENQRTETTAAISQMTGTWQSFCMLHIIRMAFLWADTESAKKAFEIWSFVFV